MSKSGKGNIGCNTIRGFGEGRVRQYGRRPAYSERELAKALETGKGAFSCKWKDCGKCFRLRGDLVDHVNTNHCGNTRPWVNQACSWDGCWRSGAFSSQNHLICHLRAHTGEKPFKCSLCKKRFSVRSNFNAHCRARHGSAHVRLITIMYDTAEMPDQGDVGDSQAGSDCNESEDADDANDRGQTEDFNPSSTIGDTAVDSTSPDHDKRRSTSNPYLSSVENVQKSRTSSRAARKTRKTRKSRKASARSRTSKNESEKKLSDPLSKTLDGGVDIETNFPVAHAIRVSRNINNPSSQPTVQVVTNQISTPMPQNLTIGTAAVCLGPISSNSLSSISPGPLRNEDSNNTSEPETQDSTDLPLSKEDLCEASPLKTEPNKNKLNRVSQDSLTLIENKRQLSGIVNDENIENDLIGIPNRRIAASRKKTPLAKNNHVNENQTSQIEGIPACDLQPQQQTVAGKVTNNYQSTSFPLRVTRAALRNLSNKATADKIDTAGQIVNANNEDVAPAAFLPSTGESKRAKFQSVNSMLYSKHELEDANDFLEANGGSSFTLKNFASLPMYPLFTIANTGAMRMCQMDSSGKRNFNPLIPAFLRENESFTRYKPENIDAVTLRVYIRGMGTWVREANTNIQQLKVARSKLYDEILDLLLRMDKYAAYITELVDFPAVIRPVFSSMRASSVDNGIQITVPQFPFPVPNFVPLLLHCEKEHRNAITRLTRLDVHIAQYEFLVQFLNADAFFELERAITRRNSISVISEMLASIRRKLHRQMAAPVLIPTISALYISPHTRSVLNTIKNTVEEKELLLQNAEKKRVNMADQQTDDMLVQRESSRSEANILSYDESLSNEVTENLCILVKDAPLRPCTPLSQIKKFLGESNFTIKQTESPSSKHQLKTQTEKKLSDDSTSSLVLLSETSSIFSDCNTNLLITDTSSLKVHSL